jgi:hypothetical protein
MIPCKTVLSCGNAHGTKKILNGASACIVSTQVVRVLATFKCQILKSQQITNTCFFYLRLYYQYYQRNVNNFCLSLRSVLFCESTAQISFATSLSRILDHTQLVTHQVGHLWKSDQLIAETAPYITYKQHTGQTPMPLAGFEPAIPTIERLQTGTLDCTATGIGKECIGVKQTLTYIHNVIVAVTFCSMYPMFCFKYYGGCN